MAAPAGAQPGGNISNSLVLLLASAMVLPGMSPVFFGWITGLLAIPVFGLLAAKGTGRGSILIRNAVLLAGVAAVLLKLTGTLLFALTLIPLGYSLHGSARGGDDEWKAVFKGCLYLGTAWLIYWAVYGAVAGFHPYQQLLELIDTGLAQSYEYYRTQAEVDAEALLYFEQAVTQTRRLIPHVLPGLLCSLVILTVWFNLLGGIRLLNRTMPGYLPWRQYSQWRLPEWLVWPAIAAATLLLVGRGETATLAVSLALVCGLLFCLQGLAVFIHLLERWKVPLALRIVFYGILIVQSYGLLLLALLGLADVWIDFRRRTTIDTQTDN